MEIVFHISPNSTGIKRQWDKFHLLGDYLIENHNAVITFVGVKEDNKYIKSVIEKMQNQKYVQNFAGLTTLDELVDILKKCDLLVCVNSFVMHLSVCLGIKMFAIIGATEPKIVIPPHIPHLYSEYAQDISLDRVIYAINHSGLI